MAMVIDNKFEIGQIVYIKTDTDQDEGLITSIYIHPGNCISYSVSRGDQACTCYGFELSVEKDLTKVG